MEPLLIEQWEATVGSCLDQQERPDLKTFLRHGSWEDLQQQIAESADDETRHQFAMLAPGFMTLRTLSDTWMSKIGPKIDSSAIWGFATLVIKVWSLRDNLLCWLSGLRQATRRRQLLQEEKPAMDRALPTMCDVCDRIGLLNNYFSRTPAFTPDLKKSCIEAGMVVIQLFSFLVRFIRNDMPVQTAQSSG